jgi:Fe-S cluster assembly ATPase SufC
LIAAITVNDSDHNKIVGTKGIVLNLSTSFVILDEIDAGLDDETKVVLLHL